MSSRTSLALSCLCVQGEEGICSIGTKNLCKQQQEKPKREIQLTTTHIQLLWTLHQTNQEPRKTTTETTKPWPELWRHRLDLTPLITTLTWNKAVAFQDYLDWLQLLHPAHDVVVWKERAFCKLTESQWNCTSSVASGTISIKLNANDQKAHYYQNMTQGSTWHAYNMSTMTEATLTIYTDKL